jgi:hypothetical protein
LDNYNQEAEYWQRLSDYICSETGLKKMFAATAGLRSFNVECKASQNMEGRLSDTQMEACEQIKDFLTRFKDEGNSCGEYILAGKTEAFFEYFSCQQLVENELNEGGDLYDSHRNIKPSQILMLTMGGQSTQFALGLSDGCYDSYDQLGGIAIQKACCCPIDRTLGSKQCPQLALDLKKYFAAAHHVIDKYKKWSGKHNHTSHNSMKYALEWSGMNSYGKGKKRDGELAHDSLFNRRLGNEIDFDNTEKQIQEQGLYSDLRKVDGKHKGKDWERAVCNTRTPAMQWEKTRQRLVEDGVEGFRHNRRYKRDDFEK